VTERARWRWLCLLICISTGAHAILLGGGGGGGVPFASPLAGVDDGYAGSGSCNSAGQTAGYCFQDPNVFNGSDTTVFNNPNTSPVNFALRSGLHVNSSSPIGWHVAGVDFPGGVDTSAGPFCNGAYVSLGNPTKPCSLDSLGAQTIFIDAYRYDWANDPAGVGCTGPSAANKTINNTGGSTLVSSRAYPYSVWCNAADAGAGVGSVNVIGFDFTPFISGTRECVGLTIANLGGAGGATNGGTLTFSNNHIDWGPEFTCQVLQLGTTAQGPSTLQVPIWLGVEHNQPWHVWVLNNYINEHDLTAYHTTDGNSFFGLGAPIFIGANTNYGVVLNQLDMHIEYNFFNEIGGRTMQLPVACNGFDYNYNVVRNFNINSGITHGEMYLQALQGSEHCPTNTVPNYGDVAYHNDINNLIWQDYGNPTFTYAIFDNNVSFGGENVYFLANTMQNEYSLNTLVFNGVRGNSSAPYYFINGGISYSAFSASPIKTVFTRNDILTASSPLITANCTGANKHPPAFYVYQVNTSGSTLSSAYGATGSLTENGATITSLRAADLGQCASVSITDAVELYCLYCANYPGYTGDTGYVMGSNGAVFSGGTAGSSTTLAVSSVTVGKMMTGQYIQGAGAATITQQQPDNTITGGTGGVSSSTLSYTVGTPVNGQELRDYAGATLSACSGPAPGTCTISTNETIANGTSLNLVNDYQGAGNYTLSSAENITVGTNAAITNYVQGTTNGAGVAIAIGTTYPSGSTQAAFGNLMNSHIRDNALYMAGAQFPGSAIDGSAPIPWVSDATYGPQLSCFTAADLAANLVGGYPPNYTQTGTITRTDPSSGSPDSIYFSDRTGTSGGLGASGNFFLDVASNAAYAAQANQTFTTFNGGGFAANNAGCGP